MKIKIIILMLLVFLVTGCFQKQEVNVFDYYSGDQKENTDSETIDLWEKGNVPTITTYTENHSDYFDNPDFLPYMTIYPVSKGTKVKGAMLISPGGAFSFQSENTEGREVAEKFAKLGYVSFVIHYRVRPYTENESGMDIARAIKLVRSKADDYGFKENQIAVIGFSAGGIANGRAVLEYGGKIDGTSLDSSYKKDDIDDFSATSNAVIMGYSFYGRLSVADLNENTFKNFDLPPTYYVYGTEDPFYRQFNAQVELLNRLNKNVEVKVLENFPHGFGIRGDYAEAIDEWLKSIF